MEKPIPPRIDIEREMDRVVRACGGQVISDLVGASPPFANADYLFERENIIAELKCLSTDKTDDAKVKAAVQKLFDRYVKLGRIPPLPRYGRFRIQSQTFPIEFQKELYRIHARPIKRRFRKANQQIKEARAELGKPDAHGLVVLVNDGNYQLEPAQLLAAVDVALGRDFSAVDSVIMLTVNQFRFH